MKQCSLTEMRLAAGSFIPSALSHLWICCLLEQHCKHVCIACCLDHVVHSRGCCQHSGLASSASGFGAAYDMRLCFLLPLCEQAHLTKIAAGLERFGSPSRTLKQAVSCTEEHLRKSGGRASLGWASAGCCIPGRGASKSGLTLQHWVCSSSAASQADGTRLCKSNAECCLSGCGL